MTYTINPQAQQDSIIAFLETEYPHVQLVVDGTPVADEDYKGNPLAKFEDETIKPFIVLWFSNVKRSRVGRSFGDYKLDSRYASVDVVVVARNGDEARTLMNDVSDRLVGTPTDGGGKLVESGSLWGQARSIDIQNHPSRWARTNRFDFGVSARKVIP